MSKQAPVDGHRTTDEAKGERRWVCPECGLENRRYGKQTEQPFCSECEWRDGLLVEMRAFGPGSWRFTTDDGYAIE